MRKNKLEADYKKEIVEAIKAAGGYARRIEDQYLVGTPDLILCTKETGIIIGEAKRFDGNLFEPSPRQYVEMCRIEDGGGMVVLIGVRIQNSVCYLAPLLRDTKGRWDVSGEFNQRWPAGNIEDFPQLLRLYKEIRYGR